ncbi:MAG: cation:proton antiporter [Candidatus Limnocylindria bacterium]
MTTDLLAAAQVVTALVLVATVVAAFTHRSPLPESIALVLVGLGGAILFPTVRLAISADLVLLVLVPGLVFEAAYALEWRDIRRVLTALVALAIPGVLLSAGVVALALHAVLGLPFPLAFIVGAITAATDPVAVIAALRRLDVPVRLRTLVEGESLLNDGTGLVLFALALRAVAGDLTFGDAVGLFAITITVSVAAGLVGGYLAAQLIRRTEHSAIQLMSSLVLAYGTYEIAAHFGLSGILATVVSGTTLGVFVRRDAPGAPIVRDFDVFWGTLAFALTSVTFLLIGFAIDIPALRGALVGIVAGTLAVVAARASIVYVPLALLRLRRGRRSPAGWSHVLFWSGLRGAVALAAALSIPPSVPERVLLQEISFGIVLLTLIIQGGTARLLVGRVLGDQAEPAGDRATKHC